MSYSRRTPAAAAGLTPTFITTEKAIACAPTCTKSTRLLSALSKRSKCVGIMFVLHQRLLVVVFKMTETYCCPVSLTSSDLNAFRASQPVFLFSALGTLSSCWPFKMDICSCAVAKRAKSEETDLKKHSAALVLKGHLFHPTNSTDSKYVTNLGLYNELMNSISC